MQLIYVHAQLKNYGSHLLSIASEQRKQPMARRDGHRTTHVMSHDSLREKYPNARDWTVVRTYHHLARFSVEITDSDSPAQWISRLRSLCPVLQQRSPADMLSEIRLSRCIDFGTVAGREAYLLEQMLRRNGFTTLREDASTVSHFPMVAGSGIIIEDQSEAEAFCLRLISEGATTQYVEA